jgi:phage terminase large subunit-like protein
MDNILRAIETPYIDAQTLLNLLADYRKPRERILRMVKNGELIRLKNGFYLIADKINHGTGSVIPYEQVANMLYGPSYVSLDWALSFYGMIPERVHTVTSMTLGREKDFQTPVGSFVYHPLSSNRYSIGITQKKAADFIVSFLMASPEKALADLVFKTCKELDREQLRVELLESKRIDREHFLQLDKSLLIDIAKSYRARSVSCLVDLLGTI